LRERGLLALQTVCVNNWGNISMKRSRQIVRFLLERCNRAFRHAFPRLALLSIVSQRDGPWLRMDEADDFDAELHTDDNWEVNDDEEAVDDVDGAVVHGDDNGNGDPRAVEVDATITRASGNASPRKVVSAVALSDVADQPQPAVPTNAEAASASGNASEQSGSPGLNNYATTSSTASRNNGIQAETEDDEFYQQDRYHPDDDDDDDDDYEYNDDEDDDSDAIGIGYDDYDDEQENRCSFDLTTLFIYMG
jgi:hypothetical protein